MDQVCLATMDASNALVTLVINVVPDGATADFWKTNSAELGKSITEIMQLPEVQEAIKSKLTAYATSVIEASKPGIPNAPAMNTQDQGDTQNAGTLSDNPVVQAVKQGVQVAGMKMVMTCTAPGIFYDQNKGTIMIIGAIVGVAGAFALWNLRSDQASSLIEGKGLDKEISGETIGAVKFEGKLMKFTPSTQEAQAAVSVKWNKNWTQYISSDIGLTGTVKGQKASWITTADSASAGVRVKLNDVMSVTGGGDANFNDGKRDMYLNFQMTQDNVAIGLEYRMVRENRPEYKHDVMFSLKKDL